MRWYVFFFVLREYTHTHTHAHIQMFSKTDIVKMLLDEGADPNRCVSTSRFDAFTYACINHRVENAAYWLKRFPKWNVNRGIYAGTSVLSWALIIPNSQDNCVEIVRLLLGAGARVGIRNKFGFTSLHFAAYSWNIPLEAFNLMIKHVGGDKTIIDKRIRARDKLYYIFSTLWYVAHWVIKWRGQDNVHHILYKIYYMCSCT